MLTDKKIIWHVLALTTVIIWGGSFISTKLLFEELTPTQILLYRTIIAYLILFLIKPSISDFFISKLDIIYLMAGLCGVTLYFIFENNALKITTASNAALIVTISPIIAFLIMKFVYKEESMKLPYFLISLFLCMVGVSLIITNGVLFLKINPLGDLLALLAAFVWAGFAIFLKKLEHVDNLIKIRKIFLYGIITTVIYMIIFNERIVYVGDYSINLILNLLFLGIVASAICYIMWGKVISNIGVSNTMIYMYFVPVSTTILGSLILGEDITWLMVLGATLIILGIHISNNFTQQS